MLLGSEIRDLVIAKLEERSPFSDSEKEVQLLGGDILDEVKPIYGYVDDFLSEAANEILSVVPLHLTPVKVQNAAPIADIEDKATGYIGLPEDYLRLHTLVMYGWTQPVHHITLEGDELYKRQFNPYTRGTCQKPVVIYHFSNLRVDTRTYQKSLNLLAYSVVKDTDMATEMTDYTKEPILTP